MFPYNLTPKEYEILKLTYTFRFLNRIQLQQILNHKDKKRINEWLKKLTKENYLGRIYSKKLLENTKPAIYYLSFRGIAYLKEREYATAQELKKYYDDKKRSIVFRNHCLQVVDIYLNIYIPQTTQNQDGKRIDSTQKNPEPITTTFLTKATFREMPILLALKPDVYYKQKKKKKMNHYLFEFIDAGVPRFALRARMKQYIDFYYNSSWTQETETSFPYVLFIAPTTRTQRFLLKYLTELLDTYDYPEDLDIRVANLDEYTKLGVFGDIWDAVKRRGDD